MAETLLRLKNDDAVKVPPTLRTERALLLWKHLNGAEKAPLPQGNSLSERLFLGVRGLGRSGPGGLAAALSSFSALLPKPLARLDGFTGEGLDDGSGGGFRIDGLPLPSRGATPLVYIECRGGQQTALSAASIEPHDCLCVLLVGRVHYRIGIPVRISFARPDQPPALEVGIGSEWLVTKPESRVWSLPSPDERAFVVLVLKGAFEIYCDGLKVAHGPLPAGGGWSQVRMEFGPRLATYSDLILHHTAVWGLDAGEADNLRHALADPGDALAEALVRDGDADGLGRLCRNDDTLRLAVSKEAAANLFTDVAEMASRGSDHWARFVAERLPPEYGAPLKFKLDAALGQPIVTAEDLVVELPRNPHLARRWFMRSAGAGDTFRAVDGVNFSLNRGDVLGIIGHNGAGKSTLLRALCGLIAIKQGRIVIADNFLLLRPGMGMRDELTGRENIFSMGFYLGLELDQIRALSDDIVSFSELGSHIDKTVAYYSDGMRARLAFSIATSFAPEVLFLDELLSAGDVSFQEKAQARLRDFIKRVGTVVVVTHSTSFVTESCSKALLMHEGRQVYFGDPKEAVARYLFLLER